MVRLNNDDVEYIKENFPKYGMKHCMYKLNTTRGKIQVVIRKYSLKVSTDGKKYIKKKTHQEKYQLKKISEKFTPKFTDIQAYALGLLWADGYLKGEAENTKYLIFSVVVDDFKYFEKSLLSLGKVSFSFIQQPNRKLKKSAFINNFGLCDWLYDIGFGGKSVSGPEKLFNFFNESNKINFIRGWSDGDGCFIANTKTQQFRFIFTGSYYQDWVCISEILKSINCKHTVHRYSRIAKNGNLHSNSVLIISGMKNLRNYISYIYNDNSDCLLRKRKKADIIMEKYYKLYGA
jgi:hypothetical protein